MSTVSNKKKKQQLGMNPGTAANRLKKDILFQLVQETGKDVCYQCGECIQSSRDLSIEHKVPWLDSEDPTGLYFDLTNIAFSHLSCNVAASRDPRPKPKCGSYVKYYEGCRCRECKDASNEYQRKKYCPEKRARRWREKGY